MQFLIKTLIDITNTGTRKRNTKESWQQNNCDIIVQTVGIRVNITDARISCLDEDTTEFGEQFIGSHKVWYFEFEPNIPDAITVDMMINDFNGVPVILKLDETIDTDTACFSTKDSQFKNIIFQKLR